MDKVVSALFIHPETVMTEEASFTSLPEKRQSTVTPGMLSIMGLRMIISFLLSGSLKSILLSDTQETVSLSKEPPEKRRRNNKAIIEIFNPYWTQNIPIYSILDWNSIECTIQNVK